MPIVISRETGEVLHMPVLTEEQKSQMLDRIVAAFLDLHPDYIREKVAELQDPAWR